MKKIIFLISALFLIVVLFGSCRPSGVVVREKPSAPYYVRPAAPYPGYIWVDGNWVRSGRGYAYRQGHWVAPRANRQRYVPGYWQHRNQGWVWRKGHW